VTDDLRKAVQPLVDAIGATIVPLSGAGESDVKLEWEGSPVFAIRLDMADAISGMISAVEIELGSQLTDLNRAGKQAAVRILDERGAFAIRKAIEDVADAMDVSRITIYNYLNAIRDA
jgi:hypothetical protein